jgi:hypothetical protein
VAVAPPPLKRNFGGAHVSVSCGRVGTPVWLRHYDVCSLRHNVSCLAAEIKGRATGHVANTAHSKERSKEGRRKLKLKRDRVKVKTEVTHTQCS